MNERALHVMCVCRTWGCLHLARREFDTVVSTGWEYDHPLLAFYADEFKTGPYPTIKTVLERVPSATIVMRHSEAQLVSRELSNLEAHLLPGTATVVLDPAGIRLWPYLEPDGLAAGPEFSPLYCRPGPATADAPDVLEVGREGSLLAIRDGSSGEPLIRARVLLQEVGPVAHPSDDHRLRKVAFRDPDGGAAVVGLAEPVHHDRTDNMVGASSLTLPPSFELREVPLSLARTLYFPRWLRAAVQACLKTGNPLVGGSTGGTR